MQDKEPETQNRSTALMLPDEAQFKRDFTAISRFQQITRQSLIPGHDYGVIPGTGNKPTLLKPGAEKIAKLLGLADEYELVDRKEDWDKPFFRYLIKCKLIMTTTGITISQGLGECNSYESKYRYRWVSERDLPASVDKSKLVSQERRAKGNTGHWTVYRMDNEEIFSQVNTILKMAKKRSLVDAALSAGRLSDMFTQDIEDFADSAHEEATEPGPVKQQPPTVDKKPQEPINWDNKGENQAEIATAEQIADMKAIVIDNKLDQSQIDLCAQATIGKTFKKRNELTKDDAGKLIEALKNWKKE